MRKLVVIISLLMTSSQLSLAQEEITWADLADVKHELEYNEKYDVHLWMPKFGEQIKALGGKQITIRGYFLDISGKGDVLLVSQNPMASCFFCGAAGPETIVEVNFVEKPPFKTDQIVEVTGIFELNTSDWNHCSYILNNATGNLLN